MVGHNRDEGAMFLPQFLNHPERMQEVDDTFDVLGPVLLLAMDEQVPHHFTHTNKQTRLNNTIPAIIFRI